MNTEKAVGQTKDAGFQIGVRKTVQGNHQDIWDFMFSEKGLGIWLGDIDPDQLIIRKDFTLSNSVAGKITVFEPYSHLRMSWKKDGWGNTSRLQLRVIKSDENKTVIAFHQEMLSGPEQREEMKQLWSNIIAAIDSAVSS
jgi:hypothetical protein